MEGVGEIGPKQASLIVAHIQINVTHLIETK